MLESKLLKEALYKQDRIGTALEGKNPTMIARTSSGFVFMMDYQFLPGWCILTAYPQVYELTSLPFDKRNEFLNDMHILGEAISSAVNPLRMNYSILGNTDNYLHAHVYPRYDWEEPDSLRKPAWFYPAQYWNDPKYLLNESHLSIAEQIRKNIIDLNEKYKMKRIGKG